MTVKSITQSQLKEVLHYDPETGKFTWLIGKHGMNKSGRVGSVLHGYHVIKINYKRYPAHRLAWLYIFGSFPSNVIDHIDQNKLNNKIENLRDVDTKTNGRNCKLWNTNKTGISGVSWSSQLSKWKCQIFGGDGKIHLGYFDDFFEACCARKSAVVKHGFHRNHH